MKMYPPTAVVARSRYSDPGVYGLALEIADTPTQALREQAGLLRNLPVELEHLTRPRLPLVIAELSQRLVVKS